MNYEGRICRTPMERGAFMLPVSVGCSYNGCRFCVLFKHLGFRILPMEEIEKELIRVSALGGNPERVFLGDGNAFSLGFGRLKQILTLVHRYFPGCRSVKMDATVGSIARMTDEELRAMQALGVRALYIGIESGLDDVLRFMNKGSSTGEAEQQIRRLQAAGIEYAAHIMTGVAGAGRGQENAAATAAFLNRTRPESITNFSMFTEKHAPLWSSVEDGSFRPASLQESMQEEHRLLQLLEIPVRYDGFQDFIKVRTRGTLPEDKGKMLASLEKNMAEFDRQRPVYACVDVEPGGCACTCSESCYEPELFAHLIQEPSQSLAVHFPRSARKRSRST